MKVSFSTRSVVLSTLCLAWFVGVVAGMCHILMQEARAGAAAHAASQWPAGLSRPAAPYSLVMVVHPHCPCSRASVAELAQLMARSEGRVHATVLFVHYARFSPQWVQTDTWRQASAIPGVEVVVDQEGALARRFGALTSGQTFVFGDNGRLLFQGGLTGTRGHEGDNANLSAALAVLHQPPIRPSRTAVFGCSLFAHPSGSTGRPPGSTRPCHS